STLFPYTTLFRSFGCLRTRLSTMPLQITIIVFTNGRCVKSYTLVLRMRFGVSLIKVFKYTSPSMHQPSLRLSGTPQSHHHRAPFSPPRKRPSNRFCHRSA